VRLRRQRASSGARRHLLQRSLRVQEVITDGQRSMGQRGGQGIQLRLCRVQQRGALDGLHAVDRHAQIEDALRVAS
jgi:hypothetical protein